MATLRRFATLGSLALVACVHAPPPPPAPPPVAPPAAVEDVPSVPRQTLPTRHMVSVTALSDAETIGPVLEMPVPPGGTQPQRAETPSHRRTALPSVRCQAVRSRDALEEKITVSCRNTDRRTHAVFLQIQATGMSGVPPATQPHVLAPKAERVLATLVTTHRPALAEIWYTHHPRK